MATPPSYQLPLPFAPSGRTCTLCGIYKPYEDFWPNAHGRYGRSERCIPCARAVQNERYRAKHPPRPREATEQGCTRCGIVKPLAAFALCKLGRYGRATTCKECRNEEAREKRAATRKTAPVSLTGKACTKCGIEKTYDAFRKLAPIRGRDRYSSRCKECEAAASRAYAREHRAERAAYQRSWRARNIEHARERQRAYYASTAEKQKEWAHTSYMRHREERLAREKEARARDPERKRQSDRKYYEQHKDEASTYRREYYQQRKEEIKAKAQAWVKQNPDKRRENARRYRQKNLSAYAAYGRLRAARRRAAEGHHTAADIARIFSDQGGLCYYCSCVLGSKYHVDHKQPVTRGGSEWPENLAATCQRCNTRKGAKTEAEFLALLLSEH